eukprot:gene12266-16447_t
MSVRYCIIWCCFLVVQYGSVSSMRISVNHIGIGARNSLLSTILSSVKRVSTTQLKAFNIDWKQNADSEDGINFDHDEVTYRVRSGEILHIPQAERYSTKDWLHNLRTMPSSRLLHRIKGVVGINAIWSFLVCLFYKVVKFNSPGARCHALLGSALGLLLVFRTNTAYNRFWEGRKIWERVLTNLRGLARFTIINSDLISQVDIERILHLICAFPIILQEHLQGFDMPQALVDLLSADEIQQMQQVTNRPYYVTNKLAKCIKNIPEQSLFQSRERQSMMAYIESITSCIGSAERIVQTPVPLTYARHTSRFLSLFCLSAPIALVGELGIFVIPFVTMMAWSLFGILEIGMLIEEPFQRALKLEVFANTIRRDISDLLHATHVSAVSLDIKSPTLGYEIPFFKRVIEENKTNPTTNQNKKQSNKYNKTSKSTTKNSNNSNTIPTNNDVKSVEKHIASKTIVTGEESQVTRTLVATEKITYEKKSAITSTTSSTTTTSAPIHASGDEFTDEKVAVLPEKSTLWEPSSIIIGEK